MKQNKQYWSDIYLRRIVILGIIPPPFGGVSVHIQRVMDCFSLQNNTLMLWFTERRLRKIFPLYILRLWWRCLLFSPDHLYYHSTYLSTSIIELLMILFLQKIYPFQLHIIEHDCRHLAVRTPFSKKIYHLILKRVASIVCIGDTTHKSYLDIYGTMLNLHIEDAFIPPIQRHSFFITQTYPSSLTIFMKDHTPLLLVSAAHLMCIDGEDMYGIDVAIQLVASIKDEYPDIGLIIGLPQIGNKKHFMQLQHLMRILQVTEHIYILHDNKEIWPLFGRIDLFLRPTKTDGDSISVREALYFNVPVVASNICVRPPTVHCYNVRDLDDIAVVTKNVLREYVYGSDRKRDYLHP